MQPLIGAVSNSTWEGYTSAGKVVCIALLGINMGYVALSRWLHLLGPLFLALYYNENYVSSLSLNSSIYKMGPHEFFGHHTPCSGETYSENDPTTYPLCPALLQVPDPRCWMSSVSCLLHPLFNCSCPRSPKVRLSCQRSYPALSDPQTFPRNLGQELMPIKS